MLIKNTLNNLSSHIFNYLPRLHRNTSYIREEIVVRAPAPLKSFPSSVPRNWSLSVPRPHSRRLKYTSLFPSLASFDFVSLSLSRFAQNIEIRKAAQITTMTTRPVLLPARHSKTAPHFNVDDPLSLWDYFIDFEALAEAAQLDEATKVKQSVIYLSRDEAEFWGCLAEYSGSNWDVFKNAVLGRYPGSIPSERWTLDDWSALCDAQKTRSIRTRGDFAEFDRKFSTISSSLVSKELLSDLEIKKCYWSSLDPEFRHLVAERVKFSKPGYTSWTILTIAEIYDAASLVLDGTPAAMSSAALQDTVSLNLMSPLEPVKEESFSMEHFTQQLSVMMAKIVETAITKAFDQATSAYAPPMQMHTSLDNCKAFFPSHANDIAPVYPQNLPWEQKEGNADDCFSNIATIALADTNVIGMSTNLVEIRSISPVKTHVESKRDRNAYSAALQWKISQREEEGDDEDLEDLILGLEARVEKLRKTDRVSHQGPQEEQAAPAFDVPSIPVRTLVPPKSAPAPVPPIFKVADHPYHVQIHRDVIVEPVEIPDHVLSRTVTLKVEDLLTLCPGARKQLEETVITQQMAMKSFKKELEKEEMTQCRAALLVEEKLCFGTIVMSRQSHSKGADTLLEPDEELAEESLAKEWLVEEEVEIEVRNQKNCSEELWDRIALSYRRNVLEVFEEGCRPVLFPYAIDSHRNKKLSMYSHSPPVESLHVSLTMDSSTPPVPACYSAPTNHCRAVSVESSNLAADRRSLERRKRRPQVLKKIVPWPPDANDEGLVPFGVFLAAVPARTHLEKLPNEEDFVCTRGLCFLLPPKFQNQSVHSVKTLTAVETSQLAKETPTLSTSVFVREREITHHRKPARIVPFFPFSFRSLISTLYLSFRHPFLPDDFRHDYRDGRLDQLKTSWIVAWARAYPMQPVDEESPMYAVEDEDSLLRECRHKSNFVITQKLLIPPSLHSDLPSPSRKSFPTLSISTLWTSFITLQS